MMRIPANWLFLLLLPFSTMASDPSVVARHGDTTLTRAELGDAPGEALRQRIIEPAINAYLRAHREQWRADPATLDKAIVAYRRARACLPYPMPAESAENERFIAGALAGNALAQGWLHRRFGGGRLLFQQSGVEAFDATRVLVEQLEADKAFEIHDPTLRAAAFDYWTRDHGAALLPASAAAEAFDPERLFSRCDDHSADGTDPAR